MQASGTVQSSGSWQQHQGPDAIYSTVALARFHPQAGFPQGCSKLSGKASVYSAPFRRRENAVVPTSPEGRLSFALIGLTPLRCSLLKCEQREGIRCLSQTCQVPELEIGMESVSPEPYESSNRNCNSQKERNECQITTNIYKGSLFFDIPFENISKELFCK